jgi:hypothetical protein
MVPIASFHLVGNVARFVLNIINNSGNAFFGLDYFLSSGVFYFFNLVCGFVIHGRTSPIL